MSVTIENRVGPVSVQGWGENYVKVVATAADEDLAERMEVGQDGRGLTVRVHRGRGGLFGIFGDGAPVSLVVQVPMATPCHVEVGSGAVNIQETHGTVDLETGSGGVNLTAVTEAVVNTGSGGVNVRQVHGRLRVETGSGAINAQEIYGEAALDTGSGHVVVRGVRSGVVVDTGSGNITVADVAGSASLDTGSGSVTVERLRGDSLVVDTGGGRVQLKAIDVTTLEVDTSSGRVEAELLAIAPNGSYEIDTGSGGVDIALPAGADLTVEVDSGSGRITHTGLPLQVHHSESGELEAQLGRGGPTLSIDSGSGAVVLRAAQPGARGDAHVDAPVVPAAPPVPPAPPAPPAPEARVMRAVSGDPALESSDQLRRVLAMVEQGKLTPEEAEEILRALDEEGAPA
jgi:DUF4097 and DUF4098 domain-containing protein YvlB